jgi:CRISPR type III-B/RAMP module-associated protein Cmr3
MGTDAFNWLRLQGPFPVRVDSPASGGTLFFAMPRDLAPGNAAAGNRVLEYLRVVADQLGTNNLPTTLKATVACFAPPSKAELPEWVDAAFLTRYLGGESLSAPERLALWDTDHRIGVALDARTHTAAAAELFAAEHLRLRKDVRLRFAVSTPPDHKPADARECRHEVASLRQSLLQLGGEQRFGLVLPAPELRFPRVEITSPLVKWLLLTPAIFAHGWRPGWIGEDGKVLLRVKPDGFNKRAHRRSRRADAAAYDRDKSSGASLAATLVAACLGKPLQIGGWDLLLESDGHVTGGGKATHLAVPAGSVFYFRCESGAAARDLAAALQGEDGHYRCRSDFFGEKGLGLGVCGNWAHQDRTFPDVRNRDNSQTPTQH